MDYFSRLSTSSPNKGSRLDVQRQELEQSPNSLPQVHYPSPGRRKKDRVRKEGRVHELQR